MSAGHCICDPLDPDDESTRIISCLKPSGNIPQPTRRINQHIPLEDTNGLIVKDDEMIPTIRSKKTTTSDSFNHFTVRIGSKDLRSGVYQLVQFAYVMYTDLKRSIYERSDIGLIILNKKIDQNGNYPEGQVSPLCLPSRYDMLSIILTLGNNSYYDL